MLSMRHHTHPFWGPSDAENFAPARGADSFLRRIEHISLIYRNLAQDISNKPHTTRPCENCGGKGGFIDITGEDIQGPIYDWFDCPACGGSQECEDAERDPIDLDDFEECFGWH